MLFAAIINLGEPSLRKTGESADGLKRRPSLVAWGFRDSYGWDGLGTIPPLPSGASFRKRQFTNRSSARVYSEGDLTLWRASRKPLHWTRSIGL
jgi:hypothetical protein